MEEKKIITGDYKDIGTGLRFVEDSRGNLHYVGYTSETGDSPAPIINVAAPIVNIPAPIVNVSPPSPQDITISIDNKNEFEKENKRYKRVLERLRMENNWLWEVIHIAIRERKKSTAKRAIDNLEKVITEKEK